METASAPILLREYELSYGITAVQIVVLATCILTFLKYAIRRQKFSKVMPSRPLKFFDILGNIPDVVSASRDKTMSLNVYILQTIAGYQQLFKEKSFVLGWLSYKPLVVITKAAAVEEIFAGTKHMEKSWGYNFLHPWLGTGLLTSHGSKWKSRRKLLQPTFHSDVLKNFLPVFNEHAQTLVKLLQKETTKPWTNVMTPIILCSLDIVCETILGVSIEAQLNGETEYVRAVQRVSESIITRLVNPLEWMDWYYYYISKGGRQQKKDLTLLHNFTMSIIAKKKKQLLAGGELNPNNKRKALMDLLVEHHIQNQSLTDEDIREEVDTFTLEGHDTTSMAMNWTLFLIGHHKEVQEKLHEELDRVFGSDTERHVTNDDIRDMEYLDRVFKEAQRIYPSVPFIARKLNEDVTLDGITLPKGIICALSTYSLHRDESVFPEPDKFDPDRFLPENTANRHPYAFVPFSCGPRNCIGQRFALMKHKIIISSILRSYTVESVDGRDKVLPAPELILRPEGPVRIRIRPRPPRS